MHVALPSPQSERFHVVLSASKCIKSYVDRAVPIRSLISHTVVQGLVVSAQDVLDVGMQPASCLFNMPGPAMLLKVRHS